MTRALFLVKQPVERGCVGCWSRGSFVYDHDSSAVRHARRVVAPPPPARSSSAAAPRASVGGAAARVVVCWVVRGCVVRHKTAKQSKCITMSGGACERPWFTTHRGPAHRPPPVGARSRPYTSSCYTSSSKKRSSNNSSHGGFYYPVDFTITSIR